MKLVLPIALTFVLVIVAGGYFYLGNYMYLVAEEDLAVHSTSDSAMGAEDDQIGVLVMNDELQVLSVTM